MTLTNERRTELEKRAKQITADLDAASAAGDIVLALCNAVTQLGEQRTDVVIEYYADRGSGRRSVMRYRRAGGYDTALICKASLTPNHTLSNEAHTRLLAIEQDITTKMLECLHTELQRAQAEIMTEHDKLLCQAVGELYSEDTRELRGIKIREKPVNDD